MSTTYATHPARTNNRRHRTLSNMHVTVRDLKRGQTVIEEDVADYLLSGLAPTTDMSKGLTSSIELFLGLSQKVAVQQPVYRNFLRALLNTYGRQSAARTCAVPMTFMTAWAEYLLDPECPDTKTTDDQAETLLFHWHNGGTVIEECIRPSNLTMTVARLTSAVNRLEMRRSQSSQGDVVSAAGGLWGNVEDHWTNTRAH